MKIIFIMIFLFFSLNGVSEQNKEKNCLEILNELKLLQEHKENSTYAKYANLILGNGYIYNMSNDEIETKIRIRILKLNLSTCK